MVVPETGLDEPCSVGPTLSGHEESREEEDKRKNEDVDECQPKASTIRVLLAYALDELHTGHVWRLRQLAHRRAAAQRGVRRRVPISCGGESSSGSDDESASGP